MSEFNIALDGPSGAGKSTVADALASHYGLTHLDTGAMYRMAALYLAGNQIPCKEGEELANALKNLKMDVKDGRFYLNGDDVSEKIRQPEVSQLASQYSALPSVRKTLVAAQQAIASRQGFILDGRDICDVVLPDAQVKFYLDASPESRARRRLLQNEQAGIAGSYQEVLDAINQRDAQDSSRETDPLRVSKQAVVVDSSSLTLEQTIQTMIDIVEQTLKKGA